MRDKVPWYMPPCMHGTSDHGLLFAVLTPVVVLAVVLALCLGGCSESHVRYNVVWTYTVVDGVPHMTPVLIPVDGEDE